MNLYWITFLIALKVSLIITYCNYRTSTKKDTKQYTFQLQYLVVYTLAFFADWLKGPYIYVLYESYGLHEDKIALLFIAGFASSAVAGPLVGSMADKFGRKRLAMAYFVIYIASALTKPFNDFYILLLGRILGGIGTSLLTTTFESWMVAEHQRRKYPQTLLDDTFAKATLCNSACAVLAGLIAQVSSDQFGYMAPFMVALIPLLVGLFLCGWWWDLDQPEGQQTLFDGFQSGLTAMNTNIWIIGLSQSFFMGAMYSFVFLWTPALSISKKTVPYGLVFATFMVMISIGSGIFKRMSHHVERMPYLIFCLSTTASMVTIFTLENEAAVFASFLMFELACGIMFPTYGSLRSLYIPNEHRTTIMNIYRIPLNVFVVIILINKKYISLRQTFGICCGAHIVCLVLWRYFTPTVKVLDGKEYEMGRVDEEKDFGEFDEHGDFKNIDDGELDEYELESNESDTD